MPYATTTRQPSQRPSRSVIPLAPNMLLPASASPAAPGMNLATPASQSTAASATRSSGPTNWVNARITTIAATWFGSNVPTPTPTMAHSASATAASSAAVNTPPSVRYAPSPANPSSGAPPTIVPSVPTTPKTTPIATADNTFADSTTLRRGSASSVGVIVWCRNSPVTANAPMISGNTYPSAAPRV